jgi:hypothetical protein
MGLVLFKLKKGDKIGLAKHLKKISDKEMQKLHLEDFDQSMVRAVMNQMIKEGTEVK